MEAILLLNIFIFLISLLNCKADIMGPSQREEMMMTDSEAEQFQKFKEAVLPHAPNNWMKLEVGLMKYFANSGRTANAAIALYKEALKLRVDFDGYKVSEEVKEFGRSAFPTQKYVDNLGRHLYFVKAKRANLTIFKENKTLIHWGFQGMWNAFEEEMGIIVAKLKTKKAVSLTTVIDVKDTNADEFLTPHAIDLFGKLLKEIDIRFPRCIQVLMLVNAPSAFEMPVALLKNTMSDFAKSVLYLYSDDDTIWIPQIAKFIDPELLADLYLKSKDPEANSPAQSATPAIGAPPIPAAGLGMGMMALGGAAIAPKEPVEKPEPPQEGRVMPKKKKGKLKSKKAAKKEKEEEDYDNPE